MERASRAARSKIVTNVKRSPERVERRDSFMRRAPVEEFATDDTLLLTTPDEQTAQGANYDGVSSFYFRVNPDGDNYATFDTGANVAMRLSLHYLDVGTETLTIGYSTNGSSENATKVLVTKTDTGRWLWAHKKISARVNHSVYSSQENADFRVYSTAAFYANGARLRANSEQVIVNWKADAFDDDLRDETAYYGDDPDLIGAWAISETYLIYDTDTDAESAGMAPLDYPFYAGATYANRASAPFRVTPAGALYSTSGQIAGWDIGVVNANTISADTGKARLNSGTPYISLGNLVNGYLDGKGFWVGKHGGDWKFHIGDPAAQVLYWDGSNLYDTGQKISGGKIGKWKISGLKIMATNDDMTFDADVPSIQLNDALVSSGTLSGSGFWVGKDTAYKLFVGSTSRYMFWNGSKLIKKGVKHKGTNELGDSDDGELDTDLMIVYGHIRSNNWVSGTSGSGWNIGYRGNATFRNVDVRGAITASVFSKGLIEAKAGTLIVAKSAGKLDDDMAVPSSGTWTMKIKDPPDTGWLFANGDIIQIKETQGSVSTTWFTVTRGSQSSGQQTYTCTFANGTRPVTYEAGNSVVDFGTSGQGWIEITADGTNAPFVSVRTHAGAPYSTVTEKARLGNLAGITDATFGALTGYGLWTDNIYLTGSINATAGTISGVLSIGASGGFYQGTGTFGSPTTGLKIYNSGGVGLLEMWGSGTKQVYFNSSGQLVAGGGDVSLDSVGLTLESGSGAANVIKWDSASAKRTGSITAYDSVGSSPAYVGIFANPNGDYDESSVQAVATGLSGHAASLTLHGGSSAGQSYAYILTETGVLIDGSQSSGVASSLLHLRSTAPTFRMEDTTASAKDLVITVDANLAKFEEAGGAASNLFVLDLANARVGVGTASPTNPFHVVSTVNNAGILLGFTGSSSSSVTATVTMYVNDGAAMASADRIGALQFGGYDGSAVVYSAYIIPVTREAWSTTNRGSGMYFYTTPNASTTAGIALLIDQDKSANFKHAIKSNHATAGIGYDTGAGGTVTQITSKATGVTLNKICGAITMNNAALAAGAKVSFVVTNSAIATGDMPYTWIASGGTANAYRADVTAVGSGSFTITVENITAGSLSEAPVIGFAVLKGVTA